jgi:hypothetical protein
VNRSSTGRQGQGRGTTLQGSHPLFKDVLGGIHDAGIYISELFQSKQVGSMLGTFKHIGRSSMNGNASGGRCRVRLLAGVQTKGLKFVFLAHDQSPYCTLAAQLQYAGVIL